ncbi:hypothetical protein QVD17_10363 [Tagetes erecta]|uniref:Uncharacterized protein n=1 Tax=Tagetes erecta TaxID=13708 RepID=A0AAD8L2S1_TARER|nr:hypothetical protein QVD17_10363 [Tagetes erecta]
MFITTTTNSGSIHKAQREALCFTPHIKIHNNGVILHNMTMTRNMRAFVSATVLNRRRRSVYDLHRGQLDDRGEGPLKDCFPDLYKLEKKKQCKVIDKYVYGPTGIGWVWEWIRTPAHGVELQQLHNCISLLQGCSPLLSTNSWRFGAREACAHEHGLKREEVGSTWI